MIIQVKDAFVWTKGTPPPSKSYIWLKDDGLYYVWKGSSWEESLAYSNTINSLESRLTNLENNETIYQLFHYIGVNQSGTITIPSNSSLFDPYGDGITDNVVVYSDSNNKPIEEVSRDSNGEFIVISSMDSLGNYTLSEAPSKGSCIIYYIKISDIYKSNVDQNSIVSSSKDDSIEYLDSVGIIDVTVPNFVDNGNGTITINHTHVALRGNPNHLGKPLPYSVNAATLTLTDGIEQYITVRLNGTIAEYYVEHDLININNSNNTVVYVMWRQGLNIHSLDQDSIGLGLSNKISNMILRTETYKRAASGGLIISESISPNPRTIIITSSTVYKGIVPQIVESFDSSIDKLTLSYNSGTNKLYSQNLVYNNTQYDNGTSLVTIPNNRWATRWFYRSIDDIKETFYVLGTGFYNNAAEASLEKERGDLSVILRNHCILVGRAIIQHNAINGVIESAFNKAFAGATVINHNDTSNIQGGISDERYHLSSSDYNDKIVNRRFGDVTLGNYTEFESDGTIRSVGEALTYRDELPSYITPVSGAAAPDLVTHTIGGVQRYLYSFDGNNTQEILSGSFEIPHDYAYGQPIEVHIHCRPSTTNLGTIKFFFDWEHSPSQSFPIAQTSLQLIDTNLQITSNKQYWHLLSSFGFLPNIGFNLGDKIGFNLRRTPTNALDTYPNDVLLEQIALHVPCDTAGSRQIYIK